MRRQYTCTCTVHSTCPECNKIRGSVCQVCVAHLSFCFEETIWNLPWMLHTKFRFIWLLGFREDFFRNQPIRNKNSLWLSCILTDGDLPQMFPTKSQFIWPSGFRGEDFQKLTNQKQELSVVVMFVNGSTRNQ